MPSERSFHVIPQCLRCTLQGERPLQMPYVFTELASGKWHSCLVLGTYGQSLAISSSLTIQASLHLELINGLRSPLFQFCFVYPMSQTAYFVSQITLQVQIQMHLEFTPFHSVESLLSVGFLPRVTQKGCTRRAPLDTSENASGTETP